MLGQIFQKIYFDYQGRLHSCVLMDDHVHFLLTSPFRNQELIVDLLKREFLRSTSLEIEVKIVPVRYRAHYRIVYKYIYRNPVQAKLAKRVEEYPYSTIQEVIGFKKGSLPLFENLELLSNLPLTLSWLNSPMPDHFLDELRNH